MFLTLDVLTTEVSNFFENFCNKNILAIKNAKFCFISVILCQTISERFGLNCIMLPTNTQKIIYQNLASILKKDPAELENAVKNFSILLSQLNLDNSDPCDYNDEEFDEEQNRLAENYDMRFSYLTSMEEEEDYFEQ